jgi:ABC-2 type transport system permease protein
VDRRRQYDWDYAVFFGSFIGLLLVGMALCSIGIFISSLTENQIVAAVGALAINILLFFANSVTYITNNSVFATICKNIAFYPRYQNFTTGILYPSDLVFFLSVILLFNFLTIGRSRSGAGVKKRVQNEKDKLEQSQANF